MMEQRVCEEHRKLAHRTASNRRRRKVSKVSPSHAWGPHTVVRELEGRLEPWQDACAISWNGMQEVAVQAGEAVLDELG